MSILSALKKKFNAKGGNIEEAIKSLEISSGGGTGTDSLVSTTYSELLALRNNGELVKGQQYRITDYVCTTTQEDTQAVSHPFDVIVFADDESTLNENARACLHEGDAYYSDPDHSSVIEAWELKYCIDNDTNRFAWADDTNGKGVIYWLKDEKNNECPYDFKQIQFSRDNNGTTEWLYTFTVYDEDAAEIVYEDASVSKQDSTGCQTYGNVIKPYRNYADMNDDRSITIQYLNNIVFNNTFGTRCNGNTFGNNCYSNTFGNYCVSNTFGNYCDSNTFGNDCDSNTFGTRCNGNTFGNSCGSNTFDNDCYSNTFGDNCYSNTFGNNCSSNTFGTRCNDNTFGNSCRFIDFCVGVSGSDKYYHIMDGVAGTLSAHLTITGTRNNTYETYVGYNSSGTLKTWVPADLA